MMLKPKERFVLLFKINVFLKFVYGEGMWRYGVDVRGMGRNDEYGYKVGMYEGRDQWYSWMDGVGGRRIA